MPEYTCREIKTEGTAIPSKHTPWQVWEGRGVIATCQNEEDADMVAEGLMLREEHRLNLWVRASDVVSEEEVQKRIDEAVSKVLETAESEKAEAVEKARSETIDLLFSNNSKPEVAEQRPGDEVPLG